MVFYNTHTPEFQYFLKNYHRMYSQTSEGKFAFVMLAEFHDCIVFDFARLLSDLKCNNISEDVPKDPEYQIHPWCHTVLADYMDHLKGNRKDTGYSPEHPDHKDEDEQKED